MPNLACDESEVSAVGRASPSTLAHRRSRRLGVAAVELAVLLPLLAFLFVIATDLARVFYVTLTLTNCARAGALYACDPSVADESPYSSVQAAALADASDLSPQPKVTTSSGVDGTGLPYVECRVATTFQTISRFPGVPSKLEVQRTVRMTMSPTKPDGNY